MDNAKITRKCLQYLEGDILILFEVTFGIKVSEVDIFSTVVLDALVNSLLEP